MPTNCQDDRVTDVERRVLRSARLADGSVVDVLVEDGVVRSVESSIVVGPDVDVVDLGGWLLVTGFVEPHAHLDKVLTADKVPNPRGDLMGAIEAWVGAAERGVFDEDEMTERAIVALDKLVRSGVTAVRTHVNVGASDPGAMHVRAIQTARREMAHLVDVQTVALMHSPLAGPDGAANRAALRNALDLGVDLVGGCPHLESDGAGMIAEALAAATDAQVPVDLHVDETLDPDSTTLVELARQVIDRGFDLGVTASHCVSLSMIEADGQAATARLVAEAGVSIVALPQTNLFLQGWDHPRATPRGIAPVGLLADHGVEVAAGADNVQDPFNPVGRSDPLETAALLVMASHVSADRALDMVSSAGRRVLGLPRGGISVGAMADFVAIDAASVRHAIADAPVSRRTFRRGRPTAVTTATSWTAR